MSGHPFLGGTEHYTFLRILQHPTSTQDKTEHTVYAGQGLLFKCIPGPVRYHYKGYDVCQWGMVGPVASWRLLLYVDWLSIGTRKRLVETEILGHLLAR